MGQHSKIMIPWGVIFALMSSCDSNFELKTSPVEIKEDCKDQCPKITKVFPLAAKPGETLSLSGENFSKGMTVVTSSGEHPVTVISATEASISTPEGGPGEVMMAAKLNEYRDDETSFFRLALDYPLITDEPIEVCGGKKFYNAKGELKEGTKNCSPDISGLKPEFIIEGVKIAGIEGKLPLCNDEGQKRCVADGAFRSASITDLASKVILGKKVAGVEGTAPPAPPACNLDGAGDCVVDGTNYKAALTTDLASKVVSGHSVAGISGNVTLPNSANVATGINYGVGGTQLTGSAGIEAHSNCASDGATGCVATATYTAALTVGLADKVLSGQTVAGVGGNVTLPAAGFVLDSVSFGVNGSSLAGSIADCSSNGEDNCYLDSGASFDAADLSNLSAGNIKSGVTIAGQAGDYPSLTNPLASNTGATDLTSLGSGTTPGSYEFFDSAGSVYSTTVAAGGTITPTTSQQDFSGASTVYNGFSVAGDADLVASNIKSSVDIFGVTGSVTEAPAACSTDGDTACVANATYTAALTTGLADKVLSGQTVAGVGGNITLPADGDVELGVTFGVGGNGSTGTFGVPAEANVATGINFGASGTEFTGSASVEAHTNCTGDGDTGCVATATYAAALTTSLADKVLSGQTVAGVGGNVTLPVVGDVESGVSYGVGGSGSTGTFAVPAIGDVQDSVTYGASGTEFTGTFTEPGIVNVESGVTYGGGGNEFTGTFGVPAEANVATGVNFGAAGTEFTGSASVEAHTNCTGDGDTGCVATATYTAALTSGLSDKVLSGQTVAGIGGNVTLPGVGDVESGVTYGSSGTEFTGNFGVPAVADVQNTVTFGAGGTEFTGTFTEPGIGNVESGVAYGGGGNEFTGTFGVPAEANVATGTNFGASGTEFTGSASIEAHTNCTGDGDTGCVATATYTAALTTSLADKVLSGQTVAGVGGNVTLPGVGDVESGVTFGVGGSGSTGTFSVPGIADVQSSVTFGAAGTEFTGTFTEPGIGNVEAGVTYGGGGSEFTGTFGVPAIAEVETGVTYGSGDNEFTGTAILESHSNCTAANQDSCIATTTYKTMDLSNKDGGGALDLNSTDFLTRMKSASLFEYWDDTGTRYTANGDGDIVSTKIKTGVDIFGASGSVAGTGTPPDPFDVRVGKVVNGVTGKLKVNCRNRANGSLYNSDSMPPGTGATTAGSSIDWWDTVDNYNSGANVLPTEQPSGWTSDHMCGRELWSDETADGSCDEASDDCLIRDHVTGLIWSEGYPVTGVASADSTKNWSAAALHCDSLNYGGRTDWRLPTQMELLRAYEHGIRDLGYKGGGTIRPSGDTLDNNDLFIADVDAFFWSASSISDLQTSAWYMTLSSGNTDSSTKTSPNRLLCVASDTTSSETAATECSSDGATGCMTNSEFKSADMSAATPDNIKSGVTIAGELGTYGGAGPGLCSSDGQVGCQTDTTYKAALTTGAADKILFGQSLAGVTGNITLPGVGSVLDSETFGVGGNGSTGTIADCSSNGEDDCYVDSGTSFDAGDLSNLAAANIKSGVTIAGQAGDYPSSTYPLPSASGTADLDSATFNAKVKSATAFEYWTSDGSYQTGAGDADITAENILSGVSIFGTSGSLQGPQCSDTSQGACEADSACRWTGSACEINPWHIRTGITISSQAGSMKSDCRNRANLGHYDYDANSGVAACSTYGNAGACGAVSGCSWSGSCTGTPNAWSNSVVDWWDTIGNYNFGGSLPTQQPAGWTSANACGSEVWSDVTADGSCNSNTDDCMLKDNLTGLIWTEGYPVASSAPTTTQANWYDAVAHCNNLTYGGRSDWRLPTQMEVQLAYIHGIREVGYNGSGTIRPGGDTSHNNDYFMSDSDIGVWTASTVSWAPSSWSVWLYHGDTYAYDKLATTRNFLCVAD